MVGKEEARNIIGFNTYAILMEDCGGLAKIISLQDHTSPQVKSKCYDLLTDHFIPTQFKISGCTKQDHEILQGPLKFVFNR